MTAIQYVHNLLQNNWETSVSGRPHDVGRLDDDVQIVYESDEDWRRMDLANYDYLAISDGGIANIDPESFGWQQESVTSRVTVDIRTRGWPNDGRPGRIALYGERGAGDLNPNESPRWGGLIGETRRVLESQRKGDQEFSLISVTEANDLSGQMGGQIWRATVTANLEVRSTTIDTSK